MKLKMTKKEMQAVLEEQKVFNSDDASLHADTVVALLRAELAAVERSRPWVKQNSDNLKAAIQAVSALSEGLSDYDFTEEPMLKTFYYTFGTDPMFPYYRGWVEVKAADASEADAKFRAKFPDRVPGSNCLNCAFVYTEEQWAKKDWPYTTPGEKCHEVIF